MFNRDCPSCGTVFCAKSRSRKYCSFSCYKKTIATHGEAAKTKEYTAWMNMKKRCYDKNYKAYKWYGQRGITVCDRWLSDYKNFLDDMGRKPSQKHSLDRIDSNGNYTPGNCRWANQHTQATNSSHPHMISLGGKTLCMRDWAKELKIGETTLSARINTYKWTVERALTTPVMWQRVRG